MQHSAKNKTEKIRSGTSPNFGRVCASAVLQKSKVDLGHWKIQFLRIVEYKKGEEANAKLSKFLKKYNTPSLDSQSKDILDRAELYLMLYDELVNDAKSDYNKIENQLRTKRNYNIPDDVNAMISKMESSEVLELSVDSKEDSANRHIIHCIVDGLASSIDTLVLWSIKYIEKLKKTQTLISTLESIINDAVSYTDTDDRTKKILKKVYQHAKTIKTILQTKYEIQNNNLESSKTRHIEPQKILLEKYYEKYAFLTGPESIRSVSVSNKSRRSRTPSQGEQKSQKKIVTPQPLSNNLLLPSYSPKTKYSLIPPLPPSTSKNNKTRKASPVIMQSHDSLSGY